MSWDYDRYILDHKANVEKGFRYIQKYLPDILKPGFDYEWLVCFHHDDSKITKDEYNAYDDYFYGGNRSYEVIEKFNKAWLHHIHNNPHHWQYWILVNDDPGTDDILIEIPYHYLIEMLCDWWAFGWKENNPEKIFTWYDEHKDHIRMNADSKDTLETILDKIKKSLEENEDDESKE